MKISHPRLGKPATAVGSRFFLRALVVFAALFIPGRAALGEKDDASPDTVHIRVQGLPGNVSMAPHAVAERLVLQRFSELHPHIKVEPAEGLQIEGLNRDATTIMMIAGGIAPDVILMTFSSLDTYVQQGLLEPLGGFLDQRGDREAILSSVKPQIRPVIERHGHDHKKNIYALPIKVLVNGIYFNRILFREAGLPERGPRDWNELLEFAKAIKVTNPENHGIFMLSGPQASSSLLSFLWSAGGDAIQEIAPGEWRAVFDTPAAVTAYMFYYQLCEAAGVVLRQSTWPSPHELLKVGMLFQNMGDTRGPRLDPDIWGFGTTPSGPNGERIGAITAELLGIYSKISDERVRQAAWEYVRFVTSEEADRIRVTSMVESGQASLVNPLALRKFGFADYLVLTPPGLEKEFDTALNSSRAEPYGRNCNLIYTEMSHPIDQMLLSRKVRSAWEAGDEETVRLEISEILTRAVKQTNLRMLDHVPPDKLAFRRVVAAIVLVGIIIAFVVVGHKISRIFLSAAKSISRPVSHRSPAPWLCLLPAIVLVLAWNYIPLVRGTLLAFLDYKIILPSTFVGLDNFANVLFYEPFWKSLVATAYYAACLLTFGFLTPILLAYALFLLPRCGVFYRTIFYLPAVISGTAVFFLWRELFNVDGIFNTILRWIGFPATRAWPEDPYLAMLSCVLPSIWAGAGPGCLIYLAALKTIPAEQFEASEIDGSGFFSKTIHIVFPGLRALVVINFVGAVAAAFHGASNILIMTGGGPDGLTQVSSLLIFFEAFTSLRFGPATAMAWIIGSMLIGFTVMQLQYLSRMEFKTVR